MIKKSILTLFMGFLLFQSNPLFSQYEWRNRACPVAFQAGGISFAIGTKAYVVGGPNMLSYASITSLVFEYDATTDSWARKNNFPHSLSGESYFVINDTAYVGIGLDSTTTYHTDFWRYDQANDQWVQVANFPGPARYEAMSFTLNGLGYIGCGHGVGQNNDFYSYNPNTNSWSHLTSFPGSPREGGIGAAAGGKGYMGFGAGNGGSYYNDIYQYNDTLNSWTPINSFTGSGRIFPGVSIINDTLYVIGGQNATTFYQDCWSYNVSNNSWTSNAGFSCQTPDSVFSRDGFTINGHGYIRAVYVNNPLLHWLLEFGPTDTAFTKRIHVLGNDTAYNGNFTRVLSVPDSCALWSTGASGPSITVSAPGKYWARWNVSCGEASDTIVITNKTGINMLSGDDLIDVYPNPSANGLFNLKVDDKIIGNTFEIFDITGRLIYRDEVRASQTAINLTAESGIYSLRITANGESYLKKLIKL